MTPRSIFLAAALLALSAAPTGADARSHRAADHAGHAPADAWARGRNP
jgi:hypothetical protein